MIHDAGGGEAMAGQDISGSGLGGAVGLSAGCGGWSRVFEQLAFSASVQLLQVLIEERRQVDLQERQTHTRGSNKLEKL